MNIILYLLSVIQSLYQQNRQLISFICKYIPLRQWAYDDSHSPEYQKFSTDTLPKVIPIPHKDWNHLLREYQRSHDGRTIKPVRRRRDCDIPDGTRCPCCGAPAEYIYRNNGERASTSARSAIPCSLRKRTDSTNPTSFAAHSVGMPSYP
jgi:hypothetical protein